jgi:hypothetical protein
MIFAARMECTKGRASMASFISGGRVRAASVLVVVLGVALMTSAATEQQPAPPDFSSDGVGWIGLNGAGPFFEPVPGQLPGPVTNDPAHPFVPNGTGKQATFRIADLSNPNLKPWAKEQMKKDIDEVLAGKTAFTAQSSCMPAGVPMFMGFGGPYPVLFRQTAKEVTMIFTEDNQVRHIYMDVPHSKNPKPSWYGESVGHYEGDTLVVDTIAQNGRTFVDVYRTPHSDKLHVVERWRLADGGKMLEGVFTVDDREAFYQPWTGMRRYNRVQMDPPEIICAENNTHNLFDYHMPTAEKPDF